METAGSVELSRKRLPPSASADAHLARYYLLHALAAMFPLSAGAMLYGRRGLSLMALLVLTTLGCGMLWRRIGRRGHALRYGQLLWWALLLGLMLPAHLYAWAEPALCPEKHAWAIVVGAAVVLAGVSWAAGPSGPMRLHPVLVTYLMVQALFGPLLTPRLVLHYSHLGVGELARAQPLVGPAREQAWISDRLHSDYDAIRLERTAAEKLTAYTRAQREDLRGVMNLLDLVSDALPSLEDLVVGGHPGPIGVSSVVMVLVGGLFLMYRGLIDYKIPLYCISFAFLGVLLMPVPVSFSQDTVQYAVLLTALRQSPLEIGAFAGYQMTATPLVFTAFFLASSGTIAPINPRAKAVFAALLGLLAAAAQLYVSAALGPYLALMVLGLCTPWLERWWVPRPLV